jgi:hypothetical protein
MNHGILQYAIALIALGCAWLGDVCRGVSNDHLGAVEPLRLHVTIAGSDANGGLSVQDALATPAGARDRIRTLRKAGAGFSGAVVEFHGGVYQLDEPFELTPEDSGSEDAPVIYAAADDEKVIWSGGTQVDNWKPTGTGLWSAELHELDSSSKFPAFRSVWIGEKRATWAGSPEPGRFLRIEGFPEDQNQNEWTRGQTAFEYAAKDAAIWERVEPGAEVVTFTRWVDSHLRITAIDRSSRTVRFSSPNVFQLAPGDLYRIEGASGLLDQPGEWCVVGERLNLSWPEEPANVVVPRLSTLVRLTGKPGSGTWVEDVEFRGIEFAHARWWFDETRLAQESTKDVIGFAQAAYGVPGAVVATGARRITFDSCHVEHTEGYGMELARGCQKIQIRRCQIEDLGAGGVKIGETSIQEGSLRTENNLVEDCTVHDGGKIHHQAVGIWIGQSPRNRIAHNLISDFDYSGISIGWTWGYGPAAAIGNIVEFNEVRNLGAREGNYESPLGDMGGIYTLGTQTDGQDSTIIHDNYFHDIEGRTIAWGIYFDEGSTGIVAENNVVLRTTHGSFHQHYGRDNILRNNILLLGRDAQLWRTRREDHQSFVLERNIIVQDRGVMLQGDWSDHFQSRRNLFWNLNGPVEFPGGISLEQWAVSRDEGSRVADPGVMIDAQRPWKIPDDSPALELGFVPFDLDKIGPRQ